MYIVRNIAKYKFADDKMKKKKLRESHFIVLEIYKSQKPQKRNS